jgi:hypothetical protein
MCAAADRDTLASVGISPSAAARAASAHGVSIKSIAAVVRARASAPSLAVSATRGHASIAAAPAAPPRPSRAALVAEAHIDGINASRKKCGLEPLTLAELEPAFVDVDREPTNTTTKKSARRTAANDMMRRQGLSTDQGSIDSIWAASAQKLNATLPSSSPRPASRAPQGQAAADAMWSSIVADGNRQAGLRTPVADRAR